MKAIGSISTFVLFFVFSCNMDRKEPGVKDLSFTNGGEKIEMNLEGSNFFTSGEGIERFVAEFSVDSRPTSASLKMVISDFQFKPGDYLIGERASRIEYYENHNINYSFDSADTWWKAKEGKIRVTEYKWPRVKGTFDAVLIQMKVADNSYEEVEVPGTEISITDGSFNMIL